MNLPPPILDDRTWEDLVEEAKRRIAAKCPDWTDFNPSDPGMVLVDVMAWMTETVLFRLNQVPDLNYIKFLELIGVRLRPARPARAWVFFKVRPNADEETLEDVPSGTRISTQPQSGREPVTFVTCGKLHLTQCQVVKTCSMYNPSSVDTTRPVINEVYEVHNLSGENPWQTEIFHRRRSNAERAKAVPHHLYLGDPALGDPLLEKFRAQTVLQVLVEVAKPMNGRICLAWEAWDGDSWRVLRLVRPDDDTTNGLQTNGHVLFNGLSALNKCEPEQLRKRQAAVQLQDGEHNPVGVFSWIDRHESTPPGTRPKWSDALWLRARLIGSEVEDMPTVRNVQLRIDLDGCVVPPSRGFSQSPPVVLTQEVASKLPYPSPVPPPQVVETSKDFYPLGTQLARGSAFYLASELFHKHRATITIKFVLRQPLPATAGHTIHWEFKPRGKDWGALGTSSPTSPPEAKGEYQFQDTTGAFTKDGQVVFVCPEDLDQSEIGGQSDWFIRARVDSAPESQIIRDVPLIAKSVLLGFKQETHPWTYCISENYSHFEAHSAIGQFTPFYIKTPQDPAFYLCFKGRPSSRRGPCSLFLDVVPQQVEVQDAEMTWESEPRREYSAAADDTVSAIARKLGVPTILIASANPDIALGQLKAGQKIIVPGWVMTPLSPVIKPESPRLKWEYASGVKGNPQEIIWNPLKVVEDGTDGFAHEGAIGFESKEDWSETVQFDELGYWIRVRWEVAEFLNPPRLRRVLLNGVEVEQTEERTLILGSSDGLPDQTFSLGESILENPEIWVRETDRTTEQAPSELNLDSETRREKERDGWWVQWKEVKTFHRSRIVNHRMLRHFVADLETGTFTFGDGRHGSIPPPARENIRMKYRVTQGAKGNVGSRTINVLESRPPNVQGVTNYHPAKGGSDREDIENAKRRGPWEVKHTNRAVTAEDFKELAQKASPLVGAAECYVKAGMIHVIIVPKVEGPKPCPSERLLREVKAYLDKRRLINTQLVVEGPNYERLDVQVDVVLKTSFGGPFSEVERLIRKALEDFVHPLTGMDEATGWPMGRAVHKSELYYLIENLSVENLKVVDHVANLMISKSGAWDWQDRIGIAGRSYPCFSENMKITRSYE